MTKVLVVDDDYTTTTLLSTLLKMEGYVTKTLLEMKGDLLELIRRENPDIIILDVLLGNLNGIELGRRLRQSTDLKDTRIIMVSGLDRATECREAGANDFLLKPFMPDELIKKLQAL
jgi:DNA-binding response OmpR family regulator